MRSLFGAAYTAFNPPLRWAPDRSIAPSFHFGSRNSRRLALEATEKDGNEFYKRLSGSAGGGGTQCLHLVAGLEVLPPALEAS